MAKKLAIVFGAVFVLVGIAAYVPNPIVGAGALFDTNFPHDVVHIVLGLILLAVAFWAPKASALWLKILGVVYLLVAVLGFLLVPNGGLLLGLVTTNMADHLLHVVLGIVLLVAGFISKDAVTPMPAAAPVSTPPSGGTM